MIRSWQRMDRNPALRPLNLERALANDYDAVATAIEGSYWPARWPAATNAGHTRAVERSITMRRADDGRRYYT